MPEHYTLAEILAKDDQAEIVKIRREDWGDENFHIVVDFGEDLIYDHQGDDVDFTPSDLCADDWSFV